MTKVEGWVRINAFVEAAKYFAADAAVAADARAAESKYLQYTKQKLMPECLKKNRHV